MCLAETSILWEAENGQDEPPMRSFVVVICIPYCCCSLLSVPDHCYMSYELCLR